MAEEVKTLAQITEELRKPFPASKIRWRIGALMQNKTKARLLAYIDARDVMERLDEVLGIAGWEDYYEDTKAGKETGVQCHLTLTLPVDTENKWANVVTKCDAAASTNIEDLKGSYSDAFKRAAVKFGIGRDLYDLKAPIVPVKDGKYFEKSDIPRLPAKYYTEKSAPRETPPPSTTVKGASTEEGANLTKKKKVIRRKKVKP